MKKLDEIMELMTAEMADFKAVILRLQMLSEQLSELSVPISTEALESKLNTFLQKQQARFQERDEILKSIGKILKNSRLIPTYLLILFGTLGILAFGALGYFGYDANAQQEENFKIYRMLLESENQLNQVFFCSTS